MASHGLSVIRSIQNFASNIKQPATVASNGICQEGATGKRVQKIKASLIEK